MQGRKVDEDGIQKPKHPNVNEEKKSHTQNVQRGLSIRVPTSCTCIRKIFTSFGQLTTGEQT